MPRGKTRDRDGIFTRKDRPGFWGSWIDASGRRRKRKFDAHTLQQARTLLADERAKAEKARVLGYVPPPKDTFSDIIKRYLAFQKGKRISAVEYERQRGIIENHLEPVFGSVPLTMIRRVDVEKYIAKRSAPPIQGRKPLRAELPQAVPVKVRTASPGTIQKELNVLKRMLECAVAWELVPTNVARRVETPTIPAGRTRYLSPTELQAALQAAPEWMRRPMALAAFTGMRRGELLGLRWKDIDLKGRRLYLRETKNGTLRVLTLNNLALQVLESCEQGLPNKLLFPDVDPARLSVYTKRVFKSVGIAEASLHSLRHTTASWLVMEGVDLYAVGQILGHKTPRMTQRYAHLSPGYMAAAVAKIDKVFAELPPASEIQGTKKVQSPSSPQRPRAKHRLLPEAT
jgi:integrase